MPKKNPLNLNALQLKTLTLFQELAKRVVKEIKDGKFKVQVSVQGDELRVTGKKRDDLQAVIQHVKGLSIEQPLQYVNFRD